MSEAWVAENLYCPRCGRLRVSHFENNKPVADFFCPDCGNEYELKSTGKDLGNKVVDGAYNTMIKRITSNSNPDFLFMSYRPQQYILRSLILIPKHFFVPDIIEPRHPLAPGKRRAGWQGCNIVISRIPTQGRIFLIRDGEVALRETVVEKVTKTGALAMNDLDSRGWIMDVLNCVNQISTEVFALSEMYDFETYLSVRHPNNKHVRDKIRQQLQILRDKGYLEFLGSGRYRKIN